MGRTRTTREVTNPGSDHLAFIFSCKGTSVLLLVASIVVDNRIANCTHKQPGTVPQIEVKSAFEYPHRKCDIYMYHHELCMLRG